MRQGPKWTARAWPRRRGRRTSAPKYKPQGTLSPLSGVFRPSLASQQTSPSPYFAVLLLQCGSGNFKAHAWFPCNPSSCSSFTQQQPQQKAAAAQTHRTRAVYWPVAMHVQDCTHATPTHTHTHTHTHVSQRKLCTHAWHSATAQLTNVHRPEPLHRAIHTSKSLMVCPQAHPQPCTVNRHAADKLARPHSHMHRRAVRSLRDPSSCIRLHHTARPICILIIPKHMPRNACN